MGMRKRLIGRFQRIADRFSGEYSEPAPDSLEPYARPGVPNEETEVVMARLNRPKSKRADDKKK